MEAPTFISTVCWIQRGFAAKVPIEMEPEEAEIQELRNNEMIAEQLEAKQMEQEQMDEEDGDMPIFGQNINELGSSKYPDVVQDLQDDEKEDYYIKDTDALIVAGKIEKQQSSLEVYIYEQQKNNLYLHHEVMLSSFPLSIEWLNTSLGSINSNNPQKGNLAIVSTFLPEIQIWNLDVIDTVEPEMILGGEVMVNKKKPKKFTNKAKKYKEGSHTDSVLSLSLNEGHKNILASGSADCTLKIWDLGQAKNIHTATHHNGRVNKVKWNPTDHSIIFSASEDHHLAVLDSRYPDDKLLHELPNKQESIECACWNLNNQSQIAYATNQGNIYMVDVRSINKPIFSVQGHPGAEITDIKTGHKNLLFTCSEDETVKVWTMNDMTHPLGLKKPKCGKMFCLDVLAGEAGPTLCCGNAKGELYVWDITESQQIDQYWKS